jgi:hydroxyacylglutathione hydrolase
VPLMVFTGDCLFAGDVGRVDLAGPDRIEEMASMQYDSIFRRLLPLGDGVIACPAHGAGSACGGRGMADRPYTTLGIERLHSPVLQDTSREAFIARVAEQREVPPYFRRMEELNVTGPPLLGRLPVPAPLSADAFARAAETAQVLDTRDAPAYNAAHLPDSISIWAEGLARYAGWFLSYDRPLLLIEGARSPKSSVRTLVRLGYDEVTGYLAGGLEAWHTAGRESRSTATTTSAQFCRQIAQESRAWILDVRPQDEIAEDGAVRGAHQLHVTQIEDQATRVPLDRPVFIFCGSGRRSTLAASLLDRQNDTRQLSVVLGGYRGLEKAARDDCATSNEATPGG